MANLAHLRQLSPYEELCHSMNIGVSVSFSAGCIEPHVVQLALNLTAQEHPYLRLRIQKDAGSLCYFDQGFTAEIQVKSVPHTHRVFAASPTLHCKEYLYRTVPSGRCRNRR